MESVKVFRTCFIDAIGFGLGSVASQGISPQQILSAVQLRRIDPAKWDDVTDDVVMMGRAVAEVRNNKKPAT